MQDQSSRTLSGKIAGFIGIAVNVLLAAGKILVGYLFGVISILADGLNNLTDCGSSILSVVSFKLSSKPADKEHPYGHERIEYVFSLTVAFIIMLVAFETVKESISKITAPTELSFSFWVIAVLAVSILAKCCLFAYYKTTAKKINSSILNAAAVDSLTDCISSAVVLISILVSRIFGVNVDGYAGILVSLFIAWSAFNILKETFSKLIGQAPDEQLVKTIKDKILSYDGVLGVHDLSVYSYGPNKYYASAHVEVDANVNVLISHELVDKIERDFFSDTQIILTGHLDPIVTDDERVNRLRNKITYEVQNIDARFSVHDFRVVFGEKQINVLFDVAVPYECAMSKEQIKEQVERMVVCLDKRYCAIITVEYNY